ncbi:MAG: M56 family metallopeptidase [Pseudomonadota bacterium]
MSNEISYAIGWTIIHSLWQSTLIALIIAISYAFTKKASAATRYWINGLGLLSCFIASCITFYINYHESVSIEIVNTQSITGISANSSPAYVQTISDIINQYINQITMVWLIGFALYICKYLADFFYCQHIKNHRYKNPNQQYQQLFNELKASLGITRHVQLRLSELVDIPCVIGHFKPVILLPASLVSGLSMQQIEMILLHELGHVRRNDYFISSLQTLITLFYFFNPFARWISSKMDEERESACDDIAVSVSGDPLFYANTLKEFAEMKSNYSTAVAITGKRNLLINRIKRLFIRDISFAKTYAKPMAIMVMFLAMIGYSVVGVSDENVIANKKYKFDEINIPLKTLLAKIEERCPSITGKITLKNPEFISGLSSNDTSCDSLAKAIQNIDRDGGEVSINVIKMPLKDVLKIIEDSCPSVAGKVALKNPEVKITFKSEKLPCMATEEIFRKLDGTAILSADEMKKKMEGPQETEIYGDLVHESIPISKEAVEKEYSAECIATFTVTKSGDATDIVPNCTSPVEEAKKYYNEMITSMIKISKFPIKMEHGKAIAVKNITIRRKWLIEKPQPSTQSDPTSNHTVESLDKSAT